MLLALLLTGLLTSTYNIRTVKGEWTGTVYIRADGGINPQTAPIKRDGDMYIFTNSIFGEIYVERNDIVIYGNGFMVEGYWSPGVMLFRPIYGFTLLAVRNVTICNTCIKNFSTAILVKNSSEIIIRENNITENECGIEIESSFDNNILKNEIYKNEYGIILTDSSINRVFENHVSKNNIVGVYLCNSSNIGISQNDITENGNGIYLHKSSSASIDENSILRNKCGIYFELSCDNTIIANEVTNNSHGIFFIESSNNIFYHNDFINNTKQVYDCSWEDPYYNPSINIWDYGYGYGFDYFLYGNYWSDYIGIDEKRGPHQDQPGPDFVGDMPYVIDDNNIDHYPLMCRVAGEYVIFNGIALEYFFHDYGIAGWRVKVEVVFQGPIYLEGKVVDVYLTPFPATRGFLDPNIEPGDIVDVSGQYEKNSNAVRLFGSVYYYMVKEMVKIVSFESNPAPLFAGQNFTYGVIVKNICDQPLQIFGVTNERFDPEQYVILLIRYNVFIVPTTILPGEFVEARPMALWRAMKPGTIKVIVAVLYRYETQLVCPSMCFYSIQQFVLNVLTSPSKTYILHVQSSPIPGIQISYSGDYSGTGMTNFDIGPKDSPFTITLTASLTYQDYTFDHWELDGVNMGETSLLTVKVDDERRERTAIAVYSRLRLDILSFLVDKTTKTYMIGTESVKFNVTLHNKLSSDAKCWVRIKLILPTPDKDKGYTQIIDTEPSEANVPAQKDISKIISWNIPANCHPGTVIAIAQIFDSNPNEVTSSNIISNKMLLLMLEKRPDISYVEIFGTEDHKVIHVHLQPYAFGTSFEYYYDWVTFWTVVDVATEFNLIAFIELLKRVPTYLQKAINLASSEPYDLTIFQIYDQVGFAFETAPATLVETSLTEVALCIGWEMAKNKLNLKGGIPRPPLENFIPIPKEFLEQPVPFYSQLHLPLMMNIEWLTPIPNTIERGRTIEIRVRASDPETKEPLDGATVHAIIGPEVGTYTRSTLLLWQVEKGVYSSQYYFSGDCQTGLWNIQVMANVPPKNGKRGFLGLSPVKSIFVGSEISPIDIKTLDIKAEPLTIGKEEYVKIIVNCTICSSQIQSYDVRVAVWEKRNFLWLFDWDNKLREDAGSLKSRTQILSQTYWEYSNIFQIKGDELGWDLWPIGKHWVVGEHMLYATVSVSWASPDSTQVRSIGRTSYCVKVTVTGDEQPLNANVIVLTEKGQKLYLNVYDSKGRRVGFDASSNSTITEIPGAYYNHGTNWTLIILPLDISDFRCLIDAKSTHETIEEYNLTIASIKNGEIKKETLNGVIEQGKIFEVKAKVEEGDIKIISKGFIEEKPLNILLITSLIIGATCVILIVIAINARRKRKLC